MQKVWKLAATAAVALVVGGCDRQATGQSVAVVNGEEISRGELNAELSRANLGEGPQAERLRSQLLQRVIDRRLMAQKAIEDGLERTPEFVINERLAREQLLIELLSRRVADSIPAPNRQQLATFIAENPGIFGQRATLTLDQIQFARPADVTILDELRDDHSLEAVAATLTELGIAHRAGSSRVDTANLPADVVRQINQLPAGEPFIIPAPNGFVVSVVRERQPVQIPADELQRLATDAWRQRQQQQLLETQLRQLRERASIDYQPGFAPTDGNQQAAGNSQ